MVFSVRQLMKYVLLSSTILLADIVNNDQAAWLHIPVCARVGLNSKVKKSIYGNAKEKTKRNHGLGKGVCRAHANRIIAMGDKMTTKK